MGAEQKGASGTWNGSACTASVHQCIKHDTAHVFQSHTNCLSSPTLCCIPAIAPPCSPLYFLSHPIDCLTFQMRPPSVSHPSPQLSTGRRARSLWGGIPRAWEEGKAG